MKKGTVRIIAVIIGLLGVAGALYFGGYEAISQLVRASDPAPHDVTITAITQTSARVTWNTDRDTEGIVEYGTQPGSLSQFAVESRASKTHGVDLTLLSPNTKYYFQIKIADKVFTDNGSPWSFSTTGGEAPTAPTPTSEAPAPEQPSTCQETACEKMKTKFGKGCTTQDYFRCVRKLTPTP